MRVRQIHQVKPAGELHPAELDQIDREQGRKDAKAEGADQSVAKRGLTLLFRQPKDHHRDNEGVVGAEQPFEGDEERDGDEVGRREHGHSVCLTPSLKRGSCLKGRPATLTRTVSMPILDSAQLSGRTGWRSSTTFTSSASRRGCSACIRRRSESTNALASCSRAARLAACAFIRKTNWSA